MEFRARNNFAFDLTGWKAAARGNGNKHTSNFLELFKFGSNMKTTDTKGKITVNQMYTGGHISSPSWRMI